MTGIAIGLIKARDEISEVVVVVVVFFVCCFLRHDGDVDTSISRAVMI